MAVEIIPSEYKILIVDDIQSNIILLQAILKHNKFQTITAMSGYEGLSKITTESPDLVLLDVMMPDISGYEVASRVKSDPATKDIPIIFVTALSDPSNIVEGFEHGCNDYITKPFNSAEIMTRIKHQLAIVASHRIILKQNEELRNVITSRDKLYSVIAHDLRSPLSSMKMALDMLVSCLSKDEIGDDMYELLTSTDQTTEELFMLLDNLLKWTKTQLGKLNVVFQNIDFGQTVAGVVETLVPIANLNSITLTLDNKSEGTVYADADMIKTILRNLIINAMKFSHNGYTIDIRTYTEDGYNVCVVQDHGIGISEENQEALRNAISITTAGARKEEGSGLGLQLCRDFTQMNHGKFWFTSKEGEGSSFYFSIPKHSTED